MGVISKIWYCIVLMLCASCSYCNTRQVVEGLPRAKDTVSYTVLGEQNGSAIIINDTIDLLHCACVIPQGITLKFKGGYIKNGTIIGNESKIASSSACFERVRIKGSWIVPLINTSLFGDLNYDNALKDVMALSNPSVKNKVTINEGIYQVSAYINDDVCLPVGSNTDLILNGIIEMVPNSFKNYNIFQLRGDNIKVTGKGVIKGDKHTHTGKDGEWGMGIDVEDAHNVYISGLTIKDCWGDCIYVGSNSSDVKIERCKLDHGRRQGISITSANSVKIRNCKITNVGGTNPEYAIDVEPNKKGKVENVAIENVDVEKCKGGFLVCGKAQEAYVGKVTIKNCILKDVTNMPISLQKCETAIVDNVHFVGCKIKEPVHRESIRMSKIGKLKIDY